MVIKTPNVKGFINVNDEENSDFIFRMFNF